MNKRTAQQGFSLLELVMVILIVTLASVPVLGQFSQVSDSLLANEEIQTAAQLTQERAEQILADRRAQGYAAIATGTTSDVLTGNYAAYGRTVTVTGLASGSSGCATGAGCKEVVISTDHAGSPRAELTFILVNY